MTVGRWRVGLAATLALTGVGLVFAEPTLLGAAVVPLVYVCYGVVSRLSRAPRLRATRTFDPDGPGPGERVTVTLNVENVGDGVLPDVRIVDGVPDLSVVGGSPRAATALAPGETASVRYTVVARRGDHAFDGPFVRVRSLSASDVHTEELTVEAGSELTCRTPARDPLADAVLRRMGQLSAGGAGDGTEFYATREYRRGDPMRRIDWRHVAKTGEFVTVQYRDQQATRTAVVVDVREPSRTRPAPDHPTGAALSVDVAERFLHALDRADALAGVGVVGLDPDGPLATAGSVAWTDGATGRAEPSTLLQGVRAEIDPADAPGADDGSGSGTVARVHGDDDGTDADTGVGTRATARSDGGPTGPTVDGDGATTGPTGDADGPTGTATGSTESIERLLGQLPPQTQVVLCTPALDDWAVEFGGTVTERGHGLVVVSPDVTGTGGVGPRLAGLRRQLRLQALEELGEVVDWTPGRDASASIREVL